MGQSTVIGQEKQSRGILVQPPYREQILLFRDSKETYHGWGCIIVGGRDNPLRLI